MNMLASAVEQSARRIVSDEVADAVIEIVANHIDGNAAVRERPELERSREEAEGDTGETSHARVLRAPAQRLSVGFSKSHGQIVGTLVLEEDGGGAEDLVSQMSEQFPGVLRKLVVGRAFAAPADSRVHPCVENFRPGLSIAHRAGTAGTLGVFVQFKRKGRTALFNGFTGASHVLGLMGRAELGDRILSPGPPDGRRDLENTIGVLRKSIELVHYAEQDDPLKVLNRTDIAVGELSTHVDFPAENMVPRISDPEKLTGLEGVVEPEDLLDLTDGGEVAMIGRTSCFRRGRLVAAYVQAFPIRLPDRRSYLYADVAIVENEMHDVPFSSAGDSGACVYTSDHRLAGFVVGGNGGYTFIHPAHSCLEEVDAILPA